MILKNEFLFASNRIKSYFELFFSHDALGSTRMVTAFEQGNRAGDDAGGQLTRADYTTS